MSCSIFSLDSCSNQSEKKPLGHSMLMEYSFNIGSRTDSELFLRCTGMNGKLGG
jgi:hypothetical protein